MVFQLLTYVPGSEPRRLWQRSNRILDTANAFLATRGLPGFPGPLSRNPRTCVVEMACARALMDALAALQRGATPEEVQAVLMEHLPE